MIMIVTFCDPNLKTSEHDELLLSNSIVGDWSVEVEKRRTAAARPRLCCVELDVLGRLVGQLVEVEKKKNCCGATPTVLYSTSNF